MRRLLAFACVVPFVACLMIVTSPGEAKVGRVRLGELIRWSGTILIARVDQVLTIDGMQVARAIPTQVFKGAQGVAPLYFVADRTWTCDISTAELGETALLFLSKAKSDRVERPLIGRPTVRVTMKPLFLIGHSGRGRMPLRTVNGRTYVTLWTGDVELPARMKTIPGPEARYAGFIRSALLSDIREAIGVRQARQESRPALP